MPFNTKFTPSQYQDRDQYNENVLNERYVTVKALRESYSHIYQELANLRNNLQDYKSEQDNQPELATAESDRIRYNNEIENRYLALKSIQLNTSYPNEYGHTIRPFSENKAAEQLRLHCHYMISGSHHFKQYHLAKTSCLELNQDTAGETIKDYDTTVDTDLMKAGTTPFTNVTVGPTAATRKGTAITAGGEFTSGTHSLLVGDKIFFNQITGAGGSGTEVAQYRHKEFFVLTVPSPTKFTVSAKNGGAVVGCTASTTSQTFEFRKYNEDQTVTFTMNSHSFATGDTTTLAGFTSTNGFDLLNGQSGTITKTSATVFTMSLKTYSIKLSSATVVYVAATDVGNCDNALAIYFPFKNFYLNKLDATNSAAVYGNGTQTFKYSDNYVTDQTVIEGHIYLLAGTSDDELDGRQTASVLGRNVQNLENMIEIVANNCNACEQSMNRIVQIAELTGVEINHN